MDSEQPRPGVSSINQATSIIEYESGIRFIGVADLDQGYQLNLFTPVDYKSDTRKPPMMWQPETYKGNEAQQYQREFMKIFSVLSIENQEAVVGEVARALKSAEEEVLIDVETAEQRLAAMFHGLLTITTALDRTLTKPELVHALTKEKLKNGLTVTETMLSLEPVREKGIVYYKPKHYQASGEFQHIPVETTKSILEEVINHYDD